MKRLFISDCMAKLNDMSSDKQETWKVEDEFIRPRSS